MVCTNVPGPQYPLYLLGHKMLRCYPYVPVGGEMALNCAILTYDGTAYFGFSGDVHAAPDLRRLEDVFEVEFQGVAGSRRGQICARRKNKRKQEERAREGEGCIDTGQPAGASSTHPFPCPPLASVESATAPVAPSYGGRKS